MSAHEGDLVAHTQYLVQQRDADQSWTPVIPIEVLTHRVYAETEVMVRRRLRDEEAARLEQRIAEATDLRLASRLRRGLRVEQSREWRIVTREVPAFPTAD